MLDGLLFSYALFFLKRGEKLVMYPLVVDEEIDHCFFQAVEMSIHKACFDVHPGMSAGKRRE